MNILIKIVFCLFVAQKLVFAGASIDAYIEEIQHKIQKIDNKIYNNTASSFEKKRKAYLQKRLVKLQKLQVEK